MLREVCISRPPAVQSADPFVVGEYGTLTLQLSVDAFGDQDPSMFTYNWDLDGDGLFGETGSDAANGDEMGATPSFSAIGIDGPASRTVSVRVVDTDGLASAASFPVAIVNVAPTPRIISIGSVRQEGTAITVTGTATDMAMQRSPAEP